MGSTQIEIEEFPEIVMKAINFAGSYLHNIFSKFNADKKTHFERYNWIKTELTSPSFEDFTFSYKNAIFPVVVDVVIDGKSLLRPELKDRLCNQSTENDLIPCVFEVVVEVSMKTTAFRVLKLLLLALILSMLPQGSTLIQKNMQMIQIH